MSQMELTGKSKNQKSEIAGLENTLEDLRAEYHALSKWRDDDVAIAAFVMSIERYGGSRVPWYLRPKLTESGFIYGGRFEVPLVDEPPSTDDYRIVTYWEAYNSSEEFNKAKEESETEQFVKDRLDWAEREFLELISLYREEIDRLDEDKSNWAVL